MPLIKSLQLEYGIVIEGLRFFPTEWLAYCYVVECINGERYFLKLHDVSVQSSFAASSFDFYLPLTYELHARGILSNIPHPIATQDGRLSTRFGEYLLVLYNLIEGKVVGHDGLTDEVLAKLAVLLGSLHRSTPEINVPSPLVERFDVVFEAELVKALDVLTSIASGDRRGKRHLRDSLLPRKEEVLDHLRRLKELQTRAITANKQMVVCHTDLHGENLMVDDRGNLYILDWENAMIAPPEHDLFFFAGYDGFWELFLPSYEREFGPVSLNSDVFGFYYYRRGLEDLTDWIVRILRGDGNEMQDQADLEEIVGCLTGLSLVEKTVAEIREKRARNK